MAVQGMLDVEYRIVVACRNGNVYTIKVCLIALLACFLH
jgi:hypothetical protein